MIDRWCLVRLRVATPVCRRIAISTLLGQKCPHPGAWGAGRNTERHEQMTFSAIVGHLKCTSRTVFANQKWPSWTEPWCGFKFEWTDVLMVSRSKGTLPSMPGQTTYRGDLGGRIRPVAEGAPARYGFAFRYQYGSRYRYRRRQWYGLRYPYRYPYQYQYRHPYRYWRQASIRISVSMRSHLVFIGGITLRRKIAFDARHSAPDLGRAWFRPSVLTLLFETNADE